MLDRLKGMAGLPGRGLKRRPRVEPLERRDLMAVYPVTNTNDGGSGSLRDAIDRLNADTSTEVDSITFDLGPGVHTIAPTSALPPITRQVNINASAPDGTPQVVLDGSNVAVGNNGLWLQSGSGSSISGLAIVNFQAGPGNGGGRGLLMTGSGSNTLGVNYFGVIPGDTGTARGNYVGVEIQSAGNTIGSTSGVKTIISGNKADGVRIDTAGATNNRIIGSIIGSDITGSASVGNSRGIAIDTAGNNIIGGTTNLERNLISGNVATTAGAVGVGVAITGPASGNVIRGNYIGVNADGTSSVGNSYGIALGPLAGTPTDAVSSTIIGAAGAGNLISGNGIGIFGNNVTRSSIAGNLIGTNAAGNAAIGNGYGIYLGASNTTIGGTSAGDRNVVSGSVYSTVTDPTTNQPVTTGGSGIFLFGNADTVQGNFVGTDITGTVPLPNGVGMTLSVINSTIGGTATGAGNVVAGNQLSGIDLFNSIGNTIQQNLIGDAYGRVGAGGLGNGGSGIQVILTSDLGTGPLNIDNTFGGPTAGAGNAILGNGGDGIAVQNQYGEYYGLSIRGNRIGPNGVIGIGLGANPAVPTPGTLNVTSVAPTGNSTTITGVFGGTPGATYIIDLYGNATANPSGYGEGQVYLGSTQVAMSAAGIAAFSLAVPGSLGGTPVVTATSTLVSGTTANPVESTGEFSPAFPLTVPTTDLSVTQTVSAPTVTRGDRVTYTTTVTNNGTNVARGVFLTDALDFTLINASITSSVGSASIGNGNVATAAIGDLAPGATATVTITALTSVAGPLGNLVGVVSLTPESNYANNTFATGFLVGVPARPAADLAITTTPSASAATVGGNLTYTITVANNGPLDAGNVTVRDFLPTNAGLVSATPSQGALTSVVGNLATLNLGTLAAGATATVSVVITPQSAGVLGNTANVSSNLFDPSPGNNSVATATPATYAGTPRLAISQALTPAVVGQDQVITVTVTNTGTAPADNVLAVDSLPSGLRFVSAAGSQGATPLSFNNVVSADLGTIAPGASAVLRIVATVTAAAAGQSNSIAAIGNGYQPAAVVTGSQVITVAAAGPSVLGVAGSRSNAQLVVGFSGPVTAASASTRANYLLYDLGTSPRALTTDDRPIGIMTAVYNQATNSASLTPSRALQSNRYYTLVVVGSGTRGIVDSAGRRLVGNSGLSGSDYSTTFRANQLAQV